MINLSDLKKVFDELKNLNEENIKIKIVVELFKRLGYDSNNFIFEHPVYHRDKRVDFIYEDVSKQAIYFETKRGDRDLTARDIVQLASYLHIRNIEWGFLCNGKRLILLNDRIQPTSQNETSLEDKIVFDLNIYSSRDKKTLDFITHASLLQMHTTNYFRDVAQFRAIKFPLGSGSWRVYKSTLMNFYTYYAEREKKYRPLEQVRIDDFERYLKYDQKNKESHKKSVNSEQTFNNKYSHLRSMFIELKKSGIIASHHFDQDRNKLITALDTVDVSKSSDHLNLINLKSIIRFFLDSENSIRDVTMLLLCVYLGLERSTLRTLKWSMFNTQFTILKLSERTITLPSRITHYLKLLREDINTKGIKGEYLFYTRYWKKFNIFSETAINEIFARLQRIDNEDPSWKVFSPQYFRMNMPRILFQNGYSIEEISYLFGLDLQSLSKLITQEDIYEKVKIIGSEQINKHPFGVVLT
ncbi:type I restriction enzyme HsdR N-terminal domain-containing protein [Cohnella nanjingensis]|uniref:Type I restriction enzyme HsdR N-terminal domain-containing protein n=1 Tax=Cohnella nanjingensis TaxID=1387779 RepID=A0A7X0VEG0_9BACL|nr:type I restriction enzyme HsdR N-terminal domain-containing protein [Cohnella nanjingensis]MBB6670238.1 type I restriction enzyme HsdR N-terminal domain-containing protein [Cohnella nanjingensis]